MSDAAEYLDWFSSSSTPDFAALKRMPLLAGEPRASLGRRDGMEEHLAMLAGEFSFKTALEFFHAGTIVHLRRGVDQEIHAERFERMWREESAFLLKALDLRWLISACDTIVDTSRDPAERMAAAAGTLLANTVKLYETERIACGAAIAAPDFDRVQGLVPLFDGLSAFHVGRGDMVRNLLARVDAVTGDSTLKGHMILREIVRRVNAGDTVYGRFAEVHKAQGAGRAVGG